MAARESLTAAYDPSQVHREDAPSFVIPAMPTSLRLLPEWFRDVHDAYTRAALDGETLRECRRAVTTLCEIHRSMADVKRGEAAMEVAQAQTRMAEVLAAFEHGGPAVAMLARLQEGLTDGRPRALPGRGRTA